MPTPDNSLVYSANSLQTFVDCQRRFELQYLQNLKWPAVEIEPVLKSEQFLENGRKFHEMIQRDLLGIPVPEPTAHQEPELARWWANYTLYSPASLEGDLLVEKTLVGVVKERLLVATYDLIQQTDDGRILIYDWKTWRKPKPKSWVLNRMQSRIYPYLIVQEGVFSHRGDAIPPDAVEMHYWYADFPTEPTSLVYSSDQFRADREYLEQLVDQIDAMEEGQFELTNNLTRCTYCPFRSYCDRGGVAGSFEESEEVEQTDRPTLMGDLDDYEAIAF